MIKILLIFTYGVSLEDWNRSGLIFRELTLYKRLKDKNNKVSVLTFGGYNDLKYSKYLNGIKIIPVQNIIKAKSQITTFLRSLFLPFTLKKEFKDVDIIKTNQLTGSWIACIAKLFYKKKIIIRGGYEYFRNFNSYKSIFGKGNLLIYLINYIKIYIFEYIAYKLADAIILASDSDIKYIIKKFKLDNKINRIFHVYNFIDVNLYKPLYLEKKINMYYI